MTYFFVLSKDNVINICKLPSEICVVSSCTYAPEGRPYPETFLPLYYHLSQKHSHIMFMRFIPGAIRCHKCLKILRMYYLLKSLFCCINKLCIRSNSQYFWRICKNKFLWMILNYEANTVIDVQFSFRSPFRCSNWCSEQFPYFWIIILNTYYINTCIRKTIDSAPTLILKRYLDIFAISIICAFGFLCIKNVEQEKLLFIFLAVEEQPVNNIEDNES